MPLTTNSMCLISPAYDPHKSMAASSHQCIPGLSMPITGNQ